MKSFNLPMLVLGGGGYTIRNVARCWAYETATLLDASLPAEIPYNDFYEYYGPDFNLQLEPATMRNENDPDIINKNMCDPRVPVLHAAPPPAHRLRAPLVSETIMKQLKELDHAPSVQMHHIPAEWQLREADEDEDADERQPTREADAHRESRQEFYAGDRDTAGDRGMEEEEEDGGDEGAGKEAESQAQAQSDKAGAATSAERVEKLAAEKGGEAEQASAPAASTAVAEPASAPRGAAPVAAEAGGDAAASGVEEEAGGDEKGPDSKRSRTSGDTSRVPTKVAEEDKPSPPLAGAGDSANGAPAADATATMEEEEEEEEEVRAAPSATTGGPGEPRGPEL